MPEIKYISSLPAAETLDSLISVATPNPDVVGGARKYNFETEIVDGSTDATVPTSKATNDRIDYKISLIPPYQRVPQQNIVYFGKHGSPTNNGTNDDDAFDTVTGALAKAKTLGGIGVVLYCSDAGTYAEDLTGVNSLTSNIEIWAPNASIMGNIAIADYSSCIVTAYALGYSSSICYNNAYRAVLTLNASKAMYYFAFEFNNVQGKIILNSPDLFNNVHQCTFNDNANEFQINGEKVGRITITDSRAPATPSNTVRYNTHYVTNIQTISYCKVIGTINHISSGTPSFTNCDCSLNIGSASSSITTSSTTGNIEVSNNLYGTLPDSKDNLVVVNGRTPQNFVSKGVNTNPSDTWYRIGEQTLLANSYSSYFVKIFGATLSGTPCAVTLDVFANASGHYNSRYKSVYGNIDNLRPFFRVYNSDTGYAVVFVKIAAGATFEIDGTNVNKGSLNFTNVLVNEGTGTDPTNITGYTLRYDTKVDDSIYYIPKTISWTGPFASASNKINITSLNEASIDVNFGIISTLGNGTVAYLQSTTPVFPTKWAPFEDQYNIACWVKENNGSFVEGTIIVLTSGIVRIMKNYFSTFTTIAGEPFVVYPFSFNSPVVN